MSDELPLLAIYADESCLGNGRNADGSPGGAGGLVEYVRPDLHEIVRRDFWVSERQTTNNRMALRSAIEAFTALSRKGQRFRVVFVSDSRYLVDGMTDWVHGWTRRGWKKSGGGAVENVELWQAAIEAASPHEIEWRWVRGHHGHPQNEYANHLATRAAAQQSDSGGLVDSEFTAWCATARAKGTLTGAPDVFPKAEQFRAARPLPRATAGRPLG